MGNNDRQNNFKISPAKTGGDPDHSVSGRIGRKKKGYGGVIPWSRPFIKVLDKILDVIDKNHSIDAIEDDEGQNAAWSAK